MGVLLRGVSSRDAIVLLPLTEAPGIMTLDAHQGYAFIRTDPMNGFPTHVVTLDVRDGTVLHTTTIAGTNPLALAVDGRAHRVFAVDNGNGGDIEVLDARNGVVTQTFTYADAAPQSALVDEGSGRLFVASDEATFKGVRVYDTARLRRVASIAAVGFGQGPGPWIVAVDTGCHRLLVGAAALMGQRLGNGQVQVIDTTTNRVIRTIPASADMAFGETSVVAVDTRSGHTFVLDRSDAHIQMLDTRTGVVLHRLPLPLRLGMLAVDERTGHLFAASGMGMGTGTGTVAMIDTRTATLRRLTPLGAIPLAVAIDSVHGRVYVACASSNFTTTRLAVLDTRTGALRATTAVDLAPLNARMVIDEQSGRVVLTGRLSSVRDAWAWLPPWLRDRIPWVPPAPLPPPPNAGGLAIVDGTRL